MKATKTNKPTKSPKKLTTKCASSKPTLRAAKCTSSKTASRSLKSTSSKATFKSTKSSSNNVKAIKTSCTKATPRKTKRQEKEARCAKIFGLSSKICACAFIALAFIAISHLVRAINVVDVATQNGIPNSWAVSSAAIPDTLTANVTYFDQTQDETCNLENRYAFSTCENPSDRITPGLVKSTLGSDGLPVASDNSADFNRWFHATSASTRHEKTLTFTRVGEANKYTYGGNGIFPLDDVDSATTNINGHNYYYTAHFSTSVRLSLTGNETFEFSGDDDLFVFLNGRLILDLGGTHSTKSASFKLGSDGSIITTVPGSADETLTFGLKKGSVAHLDIFYAERDGRESNTKITLSNFVWPAVAESKLTAAIINNQYIQYVSSISNPDKDHELTLNRLAAYHTDTVTKVSGFLPLSADSLEYTYTPEDPKSWQHIIISDPTASLDGFTLGNVLKLAPAGAKNSTVYFRFHVAPGETKIGYIDTVAYYATTSDGLAGVAYGSISLEKSGLALMTSGTTTVPTETNPSVNMSDDTIDGNPGDYAPVYGETIFIPSMDTLNEISASLFGSPFDAVAGNYSITMIILFIFAGSFACTYGFRRYARRGHYNSSAKIFKR